MNSSLLKNIYKEVLKLKEQAPPATGADAAAPPSAVPPSAVPGPAIPAAAATTAPDSNAATAMPSEPTAAGAAPPPAISGATPTDPTASGAPAAVEPDADGADSNDGEEGIGEDEIPEGQPPVNKEDPIAGVFDYAKQLAGKTINVDTILTGIKASIQSNFGGNYEAAWPVVQRLKDTENRTLIDVANRLSLFISGTIQENKNKGSKPMRVSKEEIKNLVGEIIKETASKSKKAKTVSVSPEQFVKIIDKTVTRKLNETALFDNYRSRVGQVRSGIEQQLLSTEIQEMAIDLFEKICQKVGIDSENLNTDAEKFIQVELDEMIVSAQELGVKLMQVATVVKTAQGTATSDSKSKSGQG